MNARNNKWLSNLIDRITKNDQSLNDTFTYYGKEVTLQSGTTDYMDVYIRDNDGYISFTFDFWTKELVIDNVLFESQAKAIISAFRRIYGYIDITNNTEEEEEE